MPPHKAPVENKAVLMTTETTATAAGGQESIPSDEVAFPHQDNPEQVRLSRVAPNPSQIKKAVMNQLNSRGL